MTVVLADTSIATLCETLSQNHPATLLPDFFPHRNCEIRNDHTMHDTGCLGLVHWDDPEGWYGEGGGFRMGKIGRAHV